MRYSQPKWNHMRAFWVSKCVMIGLVYKSTQKHFWQKWNKCSASTIYLVTFYMLSTPVKPTALHIFANLSDWAWPRRSWLVQLFVSAFWIDSNKWWVLIGPTTFWHVFWACLLTTLAYPWLILEALTLLSANRSDMETHHWIIDIFRHLQGFAPTFIGLRIGKIYRKPWILPSNMDVSCKLSHQPISGNLCGLKKKYK